MANPYLLLAYIGMILVGLIAIISWKIKKRVRWKYFAFGALMWVIAIAPKLIMDFTVTPIFYKGLEAYGAFVVLIGLGLYVGLRTGFFESGFSYIAVLKTRFRKMNLNEAIAFGIGFGSIEAIFLGFSGFANIIIFILNPGLLNLLPPAQQAALNLSTIVIFTPILERIFTLSVHIFSSILVVYSVVKNKINYLALSIIFKTILDGMAPMISSYFNLITVFGIYMAEIPVMIFGVVSYLGIKWIMKKF